VINATAGQFGKADLTAMAFSSWFFRTNHQRLRYWY